MISLLAAHNSQFTTRLHTIIHRFELLILYFFNQEKNLIVAQNSLFNFPFVESIDNVFFLWPGKKLFFGLPQVVRPFMYNFKNQQRNTTQRAKAKRRRDLKTKRSWKWNSIPMFTFNVSCFNRRTWKNKNVDEHKFSFYKTAVM